MDFLLFAFGSAQAFMVLFWKVGFRRVLRHELFADLFATVLLAVLFAGTYSGMVVALIGGLLVSLELRAVMYFGGYHKHRIPRRWWFDSVVILRSNRRNA